MAGGGTSPAGTSPYGVGTPAVAPVPGGAIFIADDGTRTGSRKIDEKTRSYAFNEFGRIVGMKDVRQLVLLAIATTKGSAIISTLGHTLSTIKDIGPDFDRRVRTVLNEALSDLVARNLVEVVEILVDTFLTPGTTQQKGARIILRWRDLTDPKKTVHREQVL